MMVKTYLEKRECYNYPTDEAFFSPHIKYPEYPFSVDTISSQPNEVYDMIRNSLYGLGLDAENFGNGNWNPLGYYVKQGAKILIKPNWVNHVNPVGGLDCTVTHPSIIRCIVDYCVIAGANIIEIGDAPIQSCKFDFLMEQFGYNILFDFLRKKGINILVTDFRVKITKRILKRILLQKKNPNIDKDKLIEFDLKEHSFFSNIDKQRYRIGDYDDHLLNLRHNNNSHKYLLHKSGFESDLIINLPKPKTHRFAGITAAQKNFIGICSDKEYLPHYRIGAPDFGGDETDKSTVFGKIISELNQRRYKAVGNQNIPLQLFYGGIQYVVYGLKKIFFNDQYINGLWHGNDTIWRTTLDINLILRYGNIDGSINFNSLPRNILSIGDLIIGGENAGPIKSSPKPMGVILLSDNCAIFDYVFCKMIKFDYNQIPTVKNSICNNLLFNYSLDKHKVKSNVDFFNNVSLNDIIFPDEWGFIPNPMWNKVL